MDSLAKAQEWINSRSRLSEGGAGMGALFNRISSERAVEKAVELQRSEGKNIAEEVVILLYNAINQGRKGTIAALKAAIADEVAYLEELECESRREAAMCEEIPEDKEPSQDEIWG
jgi:hypothetical protein